ncbi:class I adenylate-forming enzyme family protein [Methylobacterium brachythecii]|uniref:Acyl-CoA synthetase (AMP-forming)/AMP-acid ligase II n=1 Tax=Methylobacterium brachythecii TaxID=1176177 RepID=A0A7W6F5G0_9HYPH|nr:class I adenylate-forming enzyme family protein [Methylobacterium brachythecii]MBB3901293.1 acyl-CoA synthetase (AMP-forming)/AMP-acid ligase II [Methylobacterium brachythecii]GLS45670.1 long-chain-fatty-acid--CoA ligase [Methylobacterium brachythecii]
MAESISGRLRAAMARYASAGLTAITIPETVGYGALRDTIDAYAAGFHAWGVARGMTVGVIAPKSLAGIAAYFGAMQAGACACFLEPGLAPEALAEQAEVVGMRHLVVDETLIERFTVPALAALAIKPLAAVRGEGAYVDEALGPQDNAMLLFTSGSTGRPKGVLLRHGALICNAEGVLSHTGTSPEDRLLHVMPLHHTNGVNNQLIVPFLAGASLILADRFKPEIAIEHLRRDGPTYMTGVPTIYARMLPHLTDGERFPNLKFLRCGSAPITPALHEQIEAAFGVPLVVSYGLSEATCTSTMNPPKARKIGTIGTVLAGQELRLFNPVTDAPAPEGGEGEIRITGPALMAGYLGSTDQPIVDGWLRTGDLGRFDADGFLAITGRIKDVIIRGGENISPALIERQLATHPAIRDCCVVGAPDADLGEVPVAFVVLREGESLDEAGLKDFIRGSLARIYVPAQIRSLDILPTNGVGKTDRKSLRSLLAA